MKKIKRFLRLSLLVLLPLLLGAKGGGCFGYLFTMSCPELNGLPNSEGLDFNNEYVAVLDSGLIVLKSSVCGEGLIAYINPPYNLYGVTEYANFNTGNIIVGEHGIIVRLTPDHHLEFPADPAGNKNLYSVDFADNNRDIIFAVGDDGTIIKSTDGGLNWELIDFPSQADLRIVQVASGNGNVIRVGGSQYTVAESTDGGETWQFVQLGKHRPLGGPQTFNAIYFVDQNIGYVGGPYGLAVKTTDGGQTWNTFVIDGFDEINSIYFTSPDSGIAVGSPGVARFTTDGGISWFEDSDVTTFLNGETITKIIPFDGHLGVVLGEGGFTLAVADDPALLTSVDSEEDIATEYNLSQNYPNPFNPSTKINYSVPEYGLVTIKVYDLLGKEVATLINEEKNAGNYEIDFNGIGLPSGVYFYQLTAGNFSETKKLVLMK